jgi:hypothetical protein
MTETLPAAAHRALGALNDLIEYCNDPGVEAFGARFELAQALSGHPRPADDPAPLRERIRRAICEADGFDFDQIEASDYQTHADAMLALIPAVPSAPADRTAILRDAADALDADMERFFAEWPDEPRNSPYALGRKDAATELRRMADEAQQPEAEDGRCPALFDQFSAHHEMRRLDPDSPERCAYCGKTDTPAAVSQPGKEA